NGENGDDTINGGSGDDLLVGEEGADVITGGPGNDTIDGNVYGNTADDRQVDTAVYSGNKDGYQISSTGTGTAQVFTIVDVDPSDGDDGIDTVEDVEVLQFADGSIDLPHYIADWTLASTIDGGTDDDVITGSSGDDIINGYAGDDHLVGDNESDTIDGGAGDDILEGGTGEDYLTGGPGDDVIDGNVSANTNDDRLIDTAIFSGNAADYSITIAGSGSESVITVTDLNTGDGDDGTDTLEDIEVLQFADGPVDLPYYIADWTLASTINGGTNDDVITGSSGADIINGLAGDDHLAGDNEGDTIDGGAGDDLLEGGTGADFLTGGPGDDIIDGNSSANTSDDRLVDTAIYSGNKAGYTVTSTGTGTTQVFTITDIDSSDGDDGTDTLEDIEVLQFADGSIDLPYHISDWTLASTINGGSENDEIYGSSGADIISGNAGNDLLSGGNEGDTLTGGTGRDRFVYDAAGRSSVTNLDEITDFTSGEDVIHFVGMTGVSFDPVAYTPFVTDVSTTVANIQADGGITNAIVFFTDGTDGYVTVKGNGTGVNFNSATIKLSGITTIIDANDILTSEPYALDDSYSFSGHLSTTHDSGLLNNDFDPDGDTLTVITTPSVAPTGDLRLYSNGSFDYSPTATGTDSFSYQVTDGNGNTSTATVNLTITSLNNAPVLAIPVGELVATEGSAFNFDLASAFFDRDADTISYSATGLPTNLTLSGSIISGTPTGGDVGAFTIEISASDGNGGEAKVDFSLAVNSSAANAPDTASGTTTFTLTANPDQVTGSGNDDAVTLSGNATIGD
ncbi:MAG: Ig-like domain-containing protein, partial [Planctomycetota bacterium]